jgi:predicted  nucleic acid-binding Zn-ribbon protein
MTVITQLHQLQEIDTEIESEEQTLSQKVSQLGERQALDNAQNQLALEKQRLEELRKQQHAAEWEIDDIASKVAAAEKQLYGGKITNPKELSSLQHEVSIMKTRSDQKETEALEIIDQAEAAEETVKVASKGFKKLEDGWHHQQHQLSDEIEQLKSRLDDLKQKRQQLAEEIESPAVKLYEKIKKQKRQPVAKVEQGICRSCRISLSVSELQRVRSGNLIQCGSCGRILFLP